MTWLKELFDNIGKAERKKRPVPMWVVDLKNDVCTQLPEDRNYKICCYPEDWDIGYIYVPVGAKVVCATSAAEARRKVEVLMEGAHPSEPSPVVSHLKNPSK